MICPKCGEPMVHYQSVGEWRCPCCDTRVGQWTGQILAEGEAEPTEEPQPTPGTSEEWFKTLVPLLGKKICDDAIEQARKEGLLVEGSGAPPPPTGTFKQVLPGEHHHTLQESWEKAYGRSKAEVPRLGVIRRFWRWLW